MGSNEKPTSHVTYKQPITLLLVVASLTLLGSIYSLVTFHSASCDQVVEQANSTFSTKNYQKTYDYLKSHQNACQKNSHGAKKSIANMQYKKYLASSAYQVGKNAEAKAAAQAALDEYAGLPQKEKDAVQDEAVFIDDMFTVMYGVESREINNGKTE